jgi:hypothetical protein
VYRAPASAVRERYLIQGNTKVRAEDTENSAASRMLSKAHAVLQSPSAAAPLSENAQVQPGDSLANALRRTAECGFAVDAASGNISH